MGDATACHFCGYEQMQSHTSDKGCRIECAQCGACLTGWCATREEARALHIERTGTFARHRDENYQRMFGLTPEAMQDHLKGLGERIAELEQLHSSQKRTDSDIIDEQELECEQLRQQVVDAQAVQVRYLAYITALEQVRHLAYITALEQDKARLREFLDRVLEMTCMAGGNNEPCTLNESDDPREFCLYHLAVALRTTLDAAMSADQ